MVSALPYEIAKRETQEGAAMAQRSIQRIRMAVLAALIVSEAALATGQTPSTIATRPRRHVLVSLAHRQLAVMQDDEVLHTFPIAVGTAQTPSPTGDFQIVQRLTNPTYYHPGKVIGPGANNPLGPRWIGLGVKGYGIHGTSEPRSIGKAASHGCIRLNNRDIQQLFAMVRVGDTVEIRAEDDEKIAAIFGSGNTVAVAAPVQTAQVHATLAGGAQ